MTAPRCLTLWRASAGLAAVLSCGQYADVPADGSSVRGWVAGTGPAPVISLALPVFNGEKYLAATLDSLLGQDFGDFELVVGDNGSTDSTAEICREYSAGDPRMTYHRSDVNRGATWNYNRLVPLARGRYFKWCAHDDLCEPSFLRNCVETLDRAPATVVLAYPRTIIIGEHGEVLDPEFVDGLDRREPTAHERLRRYVAHPGEQHAVFGLIRTEVLRRTRLIRNCWGGDLALLAELLLLGEFCEVDDRAFLRRYHPGTSMLTFASFVDQATWFDPRKHGRPALPRLRLLAELLANVFRSPLAPAERARCAQAVVEGWTRMYWRQMGGEVKLALRHWGRVGAARVPRVGGGR